MWKEYEKSLNELQLYIYVTKCIPSEKQWNYYAYGEKLLSSQTIEFYSGINFKKLCRKIQKAIKNKE